MLLSAVKAFLSNSRTISLLEGLLLLRKPRLGKRSFGWGDLVGGCSSNRVILFSALLVSLFLAGCARPGPDRLTPTEAPSDATFVKVMVATSRARLAPDQNIFTSERARQLNYAEFTLALPHSKFASAQTISIATSDPSDNFLTVEQAALTPSQFHQEVNARLRTSSKHNVYVFVHGFNNNFQESLFRIAQVAADTQVDGPVILFSWPSFANVIGYVGDKDSVAYSRDYLAKLLIDLAADPSVNRIGVLAHSMGGWLTVETLRQLRLTGRQSVLNRLNVVLAAPDIDIDLFRQQLRVIGPMQKPMTLLVAKNDQALAISSMLGQAKVRVGNIDVADPRVEEAAQRADVRVIDITSVSNGQGFGHDGFVYVAALYPRISPSIPPSQQGPGVYILNGSTGELETVSR